jgi:hypothetical protein
MRSDEICASERSGCTVVGWMQADTRTLAFPVPQRESNLNAMRVAWKVAQPEYKQTVVALGQAVKAP